MEIVKINIGDNMEQKNYKICVNNKLRLRGREMKKFVVNIPIAGYVYKEVEAESKEEALEKAFDEGYKDDEIAELDMYDVLVEGNVCYTYHTKAYVEEIEE